MQCNLATLHSDILTHQGAESVELPPLKTILSYKHIYQDNERNFK